MINIAHSLKDITASTKCPVQQQLQPFVPRSSARKKASDEEAQEKWLEFQRDIQEIQDIEEAKWRSAAEATAKDRAAAATAAATATATTATTATATATAVAPATAKCREKRPDIQESDGPKPSARDAGCAFFAAHSKFIFISAADPKCRADVSGCCMPIRDRVSMGVITCVQHCASP